MRSKAQRHRAAIWFTVAITIGVVGSCWASSLRGEHRGGGATSGSAHSQPALEIGRVGPSFKGLQLGISERDLDTATQALGLVLVDQAIDIQIRWRCPPDIGALAACSLGLVHDGMAVSHICLSKPPATLEQFLAAVDEPSRIEMIRSGFEFKLGSPGVKSYQWNGKRGAVAFRLDAGKVVKIEIKGGAVELLFEAEGMDLREFAGKFWNAYGKGSLDPFVAEELGFTRAGYRNKDADAGYRLEIFDLELAGQRGRLPLRERVILVERGVRGKFGD